MSAAVRSPTRKNRPRAAKEVLRYIARRYAYKEIVRELHISVKTVESHVGGVCRKLQLTNRYELSRWASERKLA